MINLLHNLDQKLFLWMNGFHSPHLDQLMVFLSGQALWVPFIVFFLWKAKMKLERRQLGVFFVFMILTLVLTDVTSSYIMKNIFDRLRPCRVDELKPLIYHFGQKCGGKYGFVSSHAANSLAVVLFSFLALELRGQYFFLLLLPVLVSFSRVYLGVHYPGDIAGGFLVGATWAFIMGKLFFETYGASRNLSHRPS